MKRPRNFGPPPFDYGAFWEDLIVDLQDPVFREQFIDVTVQLQADYQEMALAEETERERGVLTISGRTAQGVRSMYISVTSNVIFTAAQSTIRHITPCLTLSNTCERTSPGSSNVSVSTELDIRTLILLASLPSRKGAEASGYTAAMAAVVM